MKKLSIPRIFAIISFYFAINFVWGTMVGVTAPSNVSYLVSGTAKTRILAALLATSALISMIVQPIAGMLSDHCTSSYGKRRPYIFIGSVIAIFSLFMMSDAKNIMLYFIAFQILQFGMSIALAAFQGFIPDLVPNSQQSIISSAMGVTLLLGNLVSFLVTGKAADNNDFKRIYFYIGMVIIICLLITIFGVKERPSKHNSPISMKKFVSSFKFSPRKNRDFSWLLVTCAFMYLGLFSVLHFVQYYLTDVLHSSTPAQDTVWVSASVLIGAAIVTALSHKLTMKFTLRKVVSTSLLFMGFTIVGLILEPPMIVVLTVGFIFGIGYGGYRGSEWALVTACLPDPNSHGKDLGIWNMSAGISQVISSWVGALLIGLGSTPSLGYKYLFTFALLCLLISFLTLKKIRKTI